MDRKKLVSLLEKHIDVSLFGKNKAKNIDDLLNEIQQKESTIVEKNGQLFRELFVVRVDVFAKTKEGLRVLVEDRQVFSDGRVRRRKKKTAVSEKRLIAEDPHLAVKRGLREELGVKDFIFLNNLFQKPAIEVTRSTSYPGIVSKYTFHDFAVLLSDSEYKKEGYVEKTKNLTTFFRWTTA